MRGMSSKPNSVSKVSKQCSQCGAEFTCGATSSVLLDKGACWCQAYPAVLPMSTAQDCRCPDCLKQCLVDGLPSYLQSITHDKALELAAGYSSDVPLQEDIDCTVENGNYVFSAWYHLKRGDCCGNGCRHCPYPYPKED